MKLYTIDYNINENYGVTEAINPETNLLYMGCKPRIDNDYTDVIEKLNFRIKADSVGKRFPEMNYEAVDFFNGPQIIDDSNLALRFEFFIISPKMKELFDSLQLPENKCRFYNIKLRIQLNTPELPYYLFQFDTNYLDLIDFKKSSFVKMYDEEDKHTYYNTGEIKSLEDWDKEEEDGSIVNIREHAFYNKLDFFSWSPYFIISEEAYKLFKDNQLKGIRYEKFYEVKEDLSSSDNGLGFLNYFGGYSVIMEGESSMDGLSLDDFPSI